MVLGGMLFAWIVGMVDGSTCHRKLNSFFVPRHFNHWKLLSLDFDASDTIVSRVRPWAVEFFVVNCVVPSWECSNSSRVVRRGVTLFQT